MTDPLQSIADPARRAALEPYLRWPSLTAMTFEKLNALGDRPFLWAKRGGAYQSQSFAEIAGRIADFAHALRAFGLQPGERVALVSENRPAWLVADIGIMSAGGVTVPAYTTNTVDDHVHILADSGARFVIVSTPVLLQRVLPAAERVDSVEMLVLMDGEPPASPTKPVRAWDSLLAAGRAARGDGVPAPLHEAARGDLACLIYTSGTGGAPKGVMLSHGAILCNAMGACDLLYELDDRLPDDEVFLSFLPLSHSYEHSAGQFFPISIGAQIYYAEGVEALGRNMAEVRPTIMTAVPRLYETLHGRILSGLRSQPKIRQKLFWKTVALGKKRYLEGRLGLFDGLLDKLLDRLVRAKVQARFGGRNKALISGGAPLNYEIGLFFTALGLRLLQGYGQTETAPIVSCNRAHKIKLETVGPAFPGVEVRIADDGEILVRGELAMLGYWNDPEATAETLKDGWVHTGDVGEIDADGYIRITDRKKDIIVLSGGDTLSPQRVEGFLQLEPEIAQAMVVGDKQPYLVGLLVPGQEAAREWAATNGKPAELAELAADPGFHAHIEHAVERVNKRLGQPERVRRFALVAEPFTTENAMLTPSMKIRRHIIGSRYAEQLAALRR